MTVEDLIKMLKAVPRGTEIRIEDDHGIGHRVIWLMKHKNILTLGWAEDEGEENE